MGKEVDSNLVGVTSPIHSIHLHKPLANAEWMTNPSQPTPACCGMTTNGGRRRVRRHKAVIQHDSYGTTNGSALICQIGCGSRSSSSSSIFSRCAADRTVPSFNRSGCYNRKHLPGETAGGSCTTDSAGKSVTVVKHRSDYYHHSARPSQPCRTLNGAYPVEQAIK